MNREYHIRELTRLSPYEILDQFPKRFDVRFDDDSVHQLKRKRAFLSAYFWRVFRHFPDIPILYAHTFDDVMKDRSLQASDHAKLGTRCFQSIVDVVEFVTPEQRETIAHEIQEATNDVYNALRAHSGRHLQTINLIDCIKLMYHPRIWDATQNAEASPSGIEKAYAVIKDVIDNDPSVRDNDMVKAVRSGSVKFNQVCQSIGLRGFPKEVNGRIFKEMAHSNYLFGMVNLYEFAADSRGSAEHLMATESPLQDSEYFSRRLQLQTCVVERIAQEDCQTNRTIAWFVKPPGKNEATGESYPGDLKFLVGKMYVCKNTGKLLTIKGNEKHLYNTTIQMRSALTCEHPDPHAICRVCFGKLANNHSRYANLGVVCSTTMVSKISQKTLSTKHFISSGQGSGIVFDTALSKFFVRGPKNTDFVFNKFFNECSVKKVIVVRDQALGLIDVENSEDISNFNPERITAFDKIRLIAWTKTKQDVSEELDLSQGGRLASMSMPLLNYIREHGYETDERNNFVIDLKDWPDDQVVFTLPDIQVSFSQHGNAIASVVESKFKNMAERISEDAPFKVLNQLFDMVVSKLDVNIATLETIIYALQQPCVGNYSMARGVENPIMGIGKDLILNRSMGTATAYQEWRDNFINPKSYEAKNKPDTMMDVFLCPREVIDEFKRKRTRRAHA